LDVLTLHHTDYTDCCDDIANMSVASQKPVKGFSQASISLRARELLPEMSQHSEDHDTLAQYQHAIE